MPSLPVREFCESPSLPRPSPGALPSPIVYTLRPVTSDGDQIHSPNRADAVEDDNEPLPTWFSRWR
jgi:hypothetical protein